jgi:DNA-binding CsgD family transcriptional regulator
MPRHARDGGEPVNPPAVCGLAAQVRASRGDGAQVPYNSAQFGCAASVMRPRSTEKGGADSVRNGEAFQPRCIALLAALELCALTLAMLASPAAGPYPSYAGFANALASALALAALLLVAAKRPSLLRAAATPWLLLASFVIGIALIGYGCGEHSSVAVLAGWLLVSLGAAWLVVLAGSCLARMDGSACLRTVFSSFALVFVIAEFAMPFMSGLPYARAALLGFALVTFGVAFALGHARGSAALSYAALFAAVLVCAIASRFSKNRIDVAFHFGLLLVLAGLLVVPFVEQAGVGAAVALSHVSNTLLMAGSECFAILVWAVLARRGFLDPSRALVALAGGRLAAALGALVGLVVGSSARSFSAVNPVVPDAIAVALAFALVAYCLIGLRSFSFEESVDGVSPDEEEGASPVPAVAAAPPAEVDPAAAVERRCERLAALRGLTGREEEVLKLMARGRSGAYIAEHLVISQNTVKTHVKHIYAKLDAHSQQDVVDLVFEADTSV